MTSKLRYFFSSRAGFDALTLFLLMVFFVFETALRFTRFLPLAVPTYLILAFAIFRFFSKNLPRRQMENARFLAMFQGVMQWFRFRRTVRGDKEHRYFKCPNCQQPLRVPRGKGKIQVTCRTCGAQFEEKS